MSVTSQIPANLVVLVGRCAAEPTARVLATGKECLQFTLLTIGDDLVRRSVPVVVERAPVGVLGKGTELVVVGQVRQRFFRAGGATATRTEVVAHDLAPTRRPRQVEQLLEQVRRSLGGG
jgi:single-stranded DNA-binding protein